MTVARVEVVVLDAVGVVSAAADGFELELVLVLVLLFVWLFVWLLVELVLALELALELAATLAVPVSAPLAPSPPSTVKNGLWFPVLPNTTKYVALVVKFPGNVKAYS